MVLIGYIGGREAGGQAFWLVTSEEHEVTDGHCVSPLGNSTKVTDLEEGWQEVVEKN